MKEEFHSLPQEIKEKIMQAAENMGIEETAEQVQEMLKRNQKGQVSNILGNYKTIFLHDPVLKGAFSVNLLTEQIDVVKPLPWYRDSVALTDVDLQYLVLYLDEHYHLCTDKRIDGVIKVAANEYRRHPIQEYLNELYWDAQERIRYALHHSLGAEISDYNYEVFLLFMLGAISRVFEPGIKFDVMLCLVGGQGIGKSTFFRFLAVKDDWFSDDIQKLDDENIFRKLQGHWIIEMSEMIATANAKSIEYIKSFLSRQKEIYKTPYDRHPKDRKRQCVFGGSSNSLDFLPLDRTGNRRSFPVMVHSGEVEVHILENETESRAYIDQMWAEAMVIYREGKHQLKLNPAIEKHLKEYQKDFMPEDTKAVRIQNYLDTYSGKMVCSMQLFYEALGHASYEEPK